MKWMHRVNEWIYEKKKWMHRVNEWIYEKMKWMHAITNSHHTIDSRVVIINWYTCNI